MGTFVGIGEAAGRHRASWLRNTPICEAKNVEVIILNQGEDPTFEEDLAQDVLEIITVFSARLYGSRSGKNQKLLDDVKKVVEEAQC